MFHPLDELAIFKPLQRERLPKQRSWSGLLQLSDIRHWLI
jgi:hypothetical protein